MLSMYYSVCFIDIYSCRINEVLFGVSTNDVLFGLSNDEISQEPTESHRLTRLAGHMLQQQSFAPQFPPPQYNADKPASSCPSQVLVTTESSATVLDVF
jgi:hypothetical protein